MARFPSMTINPAGEAKEKSWWVYTLLGVVLLFAGAFVLANLVFASAVSATINFAEVTNFAVPTCVGNSDGITQFCRVERHECFAMVRHDRLPGRGSTSKASRLTPEGTYSLGASCSRGSYIADLRFRCMSLL